MGGDLPRKLPEADSDEVLAQLDLLLHSPDFRRAPRLQQFLQFFVCRYLAGDQAVLKENGIGVELFRRTDYDSSRDTVVRATAARVRRKLLNYYSKDNQADPWIIELPADTYVPRIRRNAKSVSEEIIPAP